MIRKIIERFRRKDKGIQLTYCGFFMANDPKYLSCMPGVREELIKKEKRTMPDACVCCLFFKWLEGEDGKIIGGRCGARPDIDKDKFDYHKRAEGCPLEEE